MKNTLLFISFINSYIVYSQNFNDRIYTKEGDSILCIITSVQTNWIYYDHKGKKNVINDYIHMRDIKSYVHNGIKKNSYEQEIKTVQSKQKIDLFTSQKDTVTGFYLDSANRKQPCLVLLNKNKKLALLSQLKKLEIIDSAEKLQVLFPDKIHGYWLNGVFYKSFKIIHKGRRVNFFARELTTGNALLYLYNGEQIDNKSIYIFKKKSETEYYFAEEIYSEKSKYETNEISQPKIDDSQYGPTPILYYNHEEPYLNYFQSYFSDCEAMLMKFKNKWYNSNDVIRIFTDYNQCK